MEALHRQYGNLYERYKNNTQVAVQWLSEKGASLGYVFGQNSSPQYVRTSEAGRKNKQKVHDVSSKDVQGLAMHIASQNTNDSVPNFVIRAIKDAIAGRKRAAAWYQQINEDRQATEADYAHGRFIGVLETALEYLQPYARAPSQGANIKQTLTEREVEKSSVPHHNFFQILDGQPLTDSDEQEAVAVLTGIRAPAERRHKTQYRCNAEEEDDEEELHLFFYCLLQDLNELRQAVKLSWMRYHQRYSSLESAAAVSHTAVLLVRQMEEDFWRSRSDEPKRKEAMDELFRRLQASGNPDCEPLHAASEIRSNLANVHDLLTRFHRRHLSLRNRKWPESDDLTIDGDLLVPIRLQGPESDLLLRLLHCYRRYFNLQKDLRLFDILTEGVKQIVFAGTESLIPIWLVFAAQNFIDQRLICGEESSLAHRDRELVWAKLLDSYTTILERKPDFIAKHKDQMTTYFQALLPQGERLKKRTELLMQENATFTGLWSLCGQVALLTFAFEVNDQGLCLLPLAYLLFFLKSEGYLAGPWRDMEMIIDTYGVERIFIGGLPSKDKELVSKLELALGFSLTRWAKGARDEWYVVNQKKRRRLDCTSMPVSLLFAKFMMTFPTTHKSFPMHRLELLLRSIGNGRPCSLKGKVDHDGQLQDELGLTDRLRDSLPLSPVRVLSRLRRVLDREAPHLHVNHFEIDNRYRPLLRRLHTVYLKHNPEAKAIEDDRDEVINELDIVPEILNSMPRFQYGDVKSTPAQDEKDAKVLKGIAGEVNTLFGKHGCDQYNDVLRLRPTYVTHCFEQIDNNGEKQLHKRPSQENLSELRDLETMIFSDLFHDPPIVALDDLVRDIKVLDDPPVVCLDEWLLQGFLASFALATCCAATFVVVAAVARSPKSVSGKKRTKNTSSDTTNPVSAENTSLQTDSKKRIRRRR